jgi:hypothetical protein
MLTSSDQLLVILWWIKFNLYLGKTDPELSYGISKRIPIDPYNGLVARIIATGNRDLPAITNYRRCSGYRGGSCTRRVDGGSVNDNSAIQLLQCRLPALNGLDSPPARLRIECDHQRHKQYQRKQQIYDPQINLLRPSSKTSKEASF